MLLFVRLHVTGIVQHCMVTASLLRCGSVKYTHFQYPGVWTSLGLNIIDKI